MPVPTARCRRADPLSLPAPRPRQKEEGHLCWSRLQSCSAQQGEGKRHQSSLCAGSHKAPLWWRQWLSTENRAFRLERVGGGSCGARRDVAPVQGLEQHPMTARAEPSSPRPPPLRRTRRAWHLPLLGAQTAARARSRRGWAGRASAQKTNLWVSRQRGAPCSAVGALGQQRSKSAGPAPGHLSPATLCRSPASRSGQLPAARVASRTHLEQMWSSSNRFARSDKCFCELCTGQRGVSGWAITQTISYIALLPQGICKVWFLFYCTFELKNNKKNQQ